MAKVMRQLKFIRPQHRIAFWKALAFVLACQSALVAQDNNILILRSAGQAFEEAAKGLRDDVGEEFQVIDEILPPAMSMNQFKQTLSDSKPFVIVLMDNPTINLYREYVAQLPDSVEVIPTVSLMGVYVDEVIKDLKNATGIRYEIPAVISCVNLRAITKSPINKIGVLYRELMKGIVEENSEYCKKERLDLVGIQLSNDAKGKLQEVRQGLKTLIKDKEVDAIWVLNDNVLLDVKILRRVWMPMAAKYKVPIIVGVEVLVDANLNFGTFAVLPDHYALGVQAAELIYDIVDSAGAPLQIPIEQPLSVYKILNLKQAKRLLDMNPRQLDQIDRIVK